MTETFPELVARCHRNLQRGFKTGNADTAALLQLCDAAILAAQSRATVFRRQGSKATGEDRVRLNDTADALMRLVEGGVL